MVRARSNMVIICIHHCRPPFTQQYLLFAATHKGQFPSMAEHFSIPFSAWVVRPALHPSRVEMNSLCSPLTAFACGTKTFCLHDGMG